MGIVVKSSAEDAKNAEAGFPVFPAGQYIMQIIDVEPTKAAKPGGPNSDLDAINVKFRITESGTGEGVGKKFTAFRVPQFTKWASGGVAFLHYQFYKALGVVFEDGDTELPDNEDLLEQEIGVTLKIGDNNSGGKRNEVSSFFPASKGITAVAPVEGDTSTDFVL